LKVAVIGAGSIGNHLSYSARKLNWNVSVFDQDPDALRRFKEDIYPSRYGKFDSAIQLSQSQSLHKHGSHHFDAILIGTPPDSHLEVLKQSLLLKPRIILIEKPICPPIETDIFAIKEIFELNSDITFLSGYNHRMSYVTQNLLNMAKLFEERIERLNVHWLETWAGILKAHPWLKGPGDTYLGSTLRGGGALFEHSHGLDLWLQIAKFFELGTPSIVRAHLSEVEIPDKEAKYDEEVTIRISTEIGFQGEVVQDVVTEPASKTIILQGDKHIYECSYGKEGKDLVLMRPLNETIGSINIQVEKSRPSDFDPSIAAIHRLFSNLRLDSSPLNLGAMSALITSYVGKCAIDSARSNSEVSIDLSDWSTLQNA
jgi:predicted dehydrogenase